MKTKYTASSYGQIYTDKEVFENVILSEGVEATNEEKMATRQMFRHSNKMRTIKLESQIIKIKKCEDDEVEKVLETLKNNNITENVTCSVWNNKTETRIYLANDNKMFVI